jgi:hypothetical protein
MCKIDPMKYCLKNWCYIVDLHLKGIVYIGHFHFKCRVLTINGLFWFMIECKMEASVYLKDDKKNL